MSSKTYSKRHSGCYKTRMISRLASCSCGKLTVRCQGEPVRVSMCHCLACQQRTGSVFGAQARWPKAQVTIAGAATEWTRTGDEGGTLTHRFCPTCGATLYYTCDDFPDVIAVPVGAFADPTFPAPSFSVYEARKHSWVSVPAAAEHMD